MQQPNVIIVMGVAGCGKTCIGQQLAQALGLPFHDADIFHPAANVAKMSAGIPLTDDDRRPWLERLAGEIARWSAEGGAVLACSALKRSYRDILRQGGGRIRFVYLKGGKDLILQRLRQRQNHFMPPQLLDSQFATLEEPGPNEALTIDITPNTGTIVDEIIRRLNI